mgnify:CR=1 FL=1
MADVLYLAELVVTGAGGAGTTTLRYASGNGHVTGPAETPANTWYDARITQPINITRNLFSRGKTSGQSQMGYGDLVLMNPDGGLDGLLEYGFDGQVVTIRRGTVGAAYPSGFPTIFSGTMEQAEAVGDTLVVRIRDRQLDLDRPLQSEKYAGNNVLPNGLEGVAGDIKDKHKPVCLGQVQNVPAVCVNTSKLIYQVADGAIKSLDAVYDRGAALVLADILAAQTSTFGTSTIFGLTYSGSLYVAVGASGKLATSPDGTTWTARTSGFGATQINGVTWGGGVFVAVGNAGTLTSSSDGTTWTVRTSQFGASAIQAVTYVASLSLFVAVGFGAKISTSSDGTTWTARTSAGFGGVEILAVTAGNGVVVAVGALGRCCTSPDGTTWTQRTTDLATANIYGVAYGGRLFVAVGSDVGQTMSIAATSPDGITWTVNTAVSVLGSSAMTSVVYADSQFAAGATGGVRASTKDGLTWVTTTVFGSDAIQTLSPDGLVLAGTNGVLKYGSSSAYASTTVLLDDTLAPWAGGFIPYLAGGFFRLGAPPAGQITADVTQGANAAARTAGQLFVKVLQRAGKTSADWSTADITALDTANAAVCGFWTDQDTTFAEVLDQIAGSVGAWWGVDAAGLYRIKRLTAPSGTAVLSLTANDLLRPLARVPASDDSKGIPTWRHTLRYAHNSRVMRGVEIAGGVSDVTRNFLALEWREARSDDPAVKASHLLAPEITEESLMYSAADALLEVARRQVMRGILRHRYELVLQLNDDTKALDLGDVVSLTHSRYGLAAGALFRIIGLEPDGIGRTITVQVWGPADPVSLTQVPRMVLAGTGTVT